MKIKLVAATLALALAPALVAAEGCSQGRQAMSCAEGSNFDHATGTCVPVTT
ncbi:hypothetical protein [Pseudosulfitobacter koreensis]|uniref:Adenylosuccinate lyase n=1 Tax=Pseudosulfitobacter koreensis TaxID=2968472 RepID=A0ABT1YXY3_9RHOB|nr:hypothetical protein [Pseudosulfitobacter koreense]MCR8825696.1 hypothetical protein [Pseudosulfitobacter koreense]